MANTKQSHRFINGKIKHSEDGEREREKSQEE